MIGLLGIGVVAGIVAGISPCVLPVLPVILVAGATDAVGAPHDRHRARRRALAVVAGVAVSFTVLTLAGTTLLSALGLPQDLLRDAGIAILVLVGIGLVVPAVGERVEALFARLHVPRPRARFGGFVLGLGTGAVFVPCAGPVLAAITVLGATRHVGATTVALTLAFSLGAALPLLLVALAGDSLVARIAWLRARTRIVRGTGGAILVLMAVAIGLNWTDGLQRVVPGYTNAIQNSVENSSFARSELAGLNSDHQRAASGASLVNCIPDDPALEDCGSAPAFADITAWLNTANGTPLRLDELRGKVVLVDFWTYSCINCQRALPHVEAWYARYHRAGLDVVGVSTPEFAFEHVVSNVADAARNLGVRYPIAIDDNYGTWNAYDNSYWPAEYLIDANGTIRHVEFGEGNYALTESLIRTELRAANPSVALPPPTRVADRTPTEETTPESYLGYSALDNLANGSIVRNMATSYHLGSTIPLNMLGLGGTWTIGPEAARAGSGATLALHYEARDVYLVLGGHGRLTVRVGQGRVRTIRVNGVPRLYTLVAGSRTTDATVTLRATPGVAAYDFTFG